MKNKVMKFIDLKIDKLEWELKLLNDSDSKQHSKYVELESMIYILNDLKNDLQVFLTNTK
jgi:chaperonin cofactor prefoldin